MGMLSGLMWNQLTQLPHPSINKSQCVNAFRRQHCTACSDICPEQVIGRNLEVKSWSSCIDCGRCASACQTRAITPSEHQLGEILALKEAGEGALYLGCEASQRENDLRRGCLCEVSWESLAYLSFYRRLVLDLAPCKACEHSGCKELLGENLRRLHTFLGAERFERAVILAHSELTAPKPRKEISRRGLFRRAGEMSKSGAETLLKNAPLLSTEDLELEGVSFRKLLHRQMKESEGTFRWEIPALREGCTGCGVCVKSCPTRALSLREEGKMLVLESWKCVGCKSCAIACPQKKINGMEEVRIRDFSPLCLTHYQSIVCRQCGAHMKAKTHNSLCGECTRKRMQTAAQRRSRREESV